LALQAAVLAYNQAWNLFDPVLNANPLTGVTGDQPSRVLRFMASRVPPRGESSAGVPLLS
jgi:hypothetical protein